MLHAAIRMKAVTSELISDFCTLTHLSIVIMLWMITIRGSSSGRGFSPHFLRRGYPLRYPKRQVGLSRRSGINAHLLSQCAQSPGNIVPQAAGV